eukprot:854896_1
MIIKMQTIISCFALSSLLQLYHTTLDDTLSDILFHSCFNFFYCAKSIIMMTTQSLHYVVSFLVYIGAVVCIVIVVYTWISILCIECQSSACFISRNTWTTYHIYASKKDIVDAIVSFLPGTLFVDYALINSHAWAAGEDQETNALLADAKTVAN